MVERSPLLPPLPPHTNPTPPLSLRVSHFGVLAVSHVDGRTRCGDVRQTSPGAPATVLPRFEELSVKMALARALNHSSQRVEEPREGAEHAQNVGLRVLKPPLPGKRPGLPQEPEPQVGAATVGHVSAGDGLPTLATGTAGEVVDAGTLAFLTRHAVEDERKAKQSKEEAEVERLEDEWVAEQLDQRLQDDWAPCAAPDGRTNFWHHSSGRARWTLPAGASCGGVKRKKKGEDEEDTLAPLWVRVLLLFMTSLTILSSCALFDWKSGQSYGWFYGPLYLAVTCLTLVLLEEYVC